MYKIGFIRATALTDVVGRIDYISNHEKQEHLMAFYDNMPTNGWEELGKCSKAKASYNVSKTVWEARELIIMIPNEMAIYNPEKLAKTYAELFAKKYKVPCAAAIHWNKSENNYHAHLVFSERKILEQSKVRIATRNTYFDAQGKRSTKALCTGSDGNLLDGCRVVAKGENLSKESFFGSKCNFFARPEWLREEKQRQIDFINKYIEGDKWMVYNWNTNPHLPYIRINKGEPASLTLWKEHENELRKEYNNALDGLLKLGDITEDQALRVKFEYMRQKKKLRQEKRKARELRNEEWQKYAIREKAENEYVKSLRKKPCFILLCELLLILAGVDVVKLQTGVEKATPVMKKIKVYPDKRVQVMIDEMYIAAGKKTPSELAMVRKVKNLAYQQNGDLNELINEAEAAKENLKEQNEKKKSNCIGG